MSCTVLAVPYALAWIIGTVVTAVATEINENNKKKENVTQPVITDISQAVCDDVKIISEANFMEKSLETPFMDKEILIKTLEEHGVQNITEEFGKIKGIVDTYSLSF